MTSTTEVTPSYPIREVFRRFYPQYEEEHPSLPEYKRKVARTIMQCRTGELGYSKSVCEQCGRVYIHNASCNNRACPCCQHPQEKKWVAERNTELIEGIAYYHVVFTVPHELNDLIRLNEEILLRLMFLCVQNTLLALCADKRYMGARPAILSVLHTWGQKLNYHPHIHVCLSGGGLTPDGTFIESRHKGFIIPLKVISHSFRGRFLCALKKLYEDKEHSLTLPESLKDPAGWSSFIDRLFVKEWLPFIKETFNGKGNAIEYLGRYSYRSAIANSRIVSIDGDTVTFRYKDYADGSAQKVMTVKGTEFIDLFLQHILPKGFSRIRYAGLLTNSQKSKNLELIHKLRRTLYLGNPYRGIKMRDLILCLFDRDIERCSCCGGHLLIVEHIRGRPKTTMPSLSFTPSAAMC